MSKWECVGITALVVLMAVASLCVGIALGSEAVRDEAVERGHARWVGVGRDRSDFEWVDEHGGGR